MAALAAGDKRGERPSAPSPRGPVGADRAVAVLIRGRVVLRRRDVPQGGKAALDCPRQESSGRAPGHPSPPGEAGVQEGGLVEKCGGHGVPGSGLQQPAGAACPRGVPEQVPGVMRGGAPGKEVLRARLASLAKRAGCKGPGGRGEVHRRAGQRQPGPPCAGAGIGCLRTGGGRHPKIRRQVVGVEAGVAPAESPVCLGAGGPADGQDRVAAPVAGPREPGLPRAAFGCSPQPTSHQAEDVERCCGSRMEASSPHSPPPVGSHRRPSEWWRHHRWTVRRWSCSHTSRYRCLAGRALAASWKLAAAPAARLRASRQPSGCGQPGGRGGVGARPGQGRLAQRP